MEIKLDQIIFQIFNFSVVVGALSYFLFKPVTRLLDDRSKKVETAQQAAEETLGERREIEQIKKKAKSAAEKEAAAIIEKAKKQAEELKRTLTAEMKADLAEERQRVESLWKQEHTATVQSLRSSFSRAVQQVASKLIATELDVKKHQKAIDQGIDELTRAI